MFPWSQTMFFSPFFSTIQWKVGDKHLKIYVKIQPGRYVNDGESEKAFSLTQVHLLTWSLQLQKRIVLSTTLSKVKHELSLNLWANMDETSRTAGTSANIIVIKRLWLTHF